MDRNNRRASGVRHFRGAVVATLGGGSRIDKSAAKRFEDWPEAGLDCQSKRGYESEQQDNGVKSSSSAG